MILSFRHKTMALVTFLFSFTMSYACTKNKNLLRVDVCGSLPLKCYFIL